MCKYYCVFFLIALFVFFNSVACSMLIRDIPATTTVELAATGTPIPTPSLPPTQIPTFIPTATITPTSTPTPTSTVYVLPGTELPITFPAITINNANLVSGLATWQENTVTSVAWPPDGEALAIANQEEINFYNPATREILRTLYPRSKEIIEIAFSPDGKWLVSANRRGEEGSGFGSSLELWLGPDWMPMGILYGAPRALSTVAFSPDSKLFFTAYASPEYQDNSVDFWNTASWRITDTLMTGTVLQIAISPNNKLLAVSPNRYAIKIRDMEGDEWLYNFHTSFTGAVNTMTFSPDGRTLATGHYDGLIRLWDMNTGQKIREIETGSVVQSLAFNRDGRLLASGGSFEDSRIRIWDIVNANMLRELTGHENGIDHLVFSPNDQYLVSASYDGSIWMWGIRP